MSTPTRSVSMTDEQLIRISWEFATLWARYANLADDGSQPELVASLREIAAEHRAIVEAVSDVADVEGTLQRALVTVRWTPEERAKAYTRARARSDANRESGI
jgi:hypothetical protein